MKRLILGILVIVIALSFILVPKEQYKSLTGRASEGTATVSFRILGPCGNILMENGWNFISICSNMTNKTLVAALAEIQGQYRYIVEWNESSQQFLIYSPLALENPFDYFNENKSYFIFIVANESEINPSGDLFDNVTINLAFGWNAPLYPYEEQSNISKYLATIDGQYRYVLKWNSSQQEFMVYSPSAASPEFTNISKGEGQFIYVANESGATLKYSRSILE